MIRGANVSEAIYEACDDYLKQFTSSLILISGVDAFHEFNVQVKGVTFSFYYLSTNANPLNNS